MMVEGQGNIRAADDQLGARHTGILPCNPILVDQGTRQPMTLTKRQMAKT